LSGDLLRVTELGLGTLAGGPGRQSGGTVSVRGVLETVADLGQHVLACAARPAQGRFQALQHRRTHAPPPNTVPITPVKRTHSERLRASSLRPAGLSEYVRRLRPSTTLQVPSIHRARSKRRSAGYRSEERRVGKEGRLPWWRVRVER